MKLISKPDPALGLRQRLALTALWACGLWFQLLLVYITRLEVFVGLLPLLWLMHWRGVLPRLIHLVAVFYTLLMAGWTLSLLWGLSPWQCLAVVLGVLGVWARASRKKETWRWGVLGLALLVNLAVNLNQRDAPDLGLLGPVLLVFLSRWVKTKWLRGAPLPRLSALASVLAVLALFRFLPFYITPDTARAPVANRQPGVEVVFASGSHIALDKSPRLFAEHCDSQHWWVGTFETPMLSRLTKVGRHTMASALTGRTSDLMWEDCALGRVVVGNFRHHSLHLLDNRTLKEYWRQEKIGGRPSYMAAAPEMHRVFFSEDIGDTTWVVDYDEHTATLTRHDLPAVDLLYSKNRLYAALHGALARVHPKTMAIQKQVFLPVFIQPQLTLDEKRNVLYVSDIILGRVWLYDADSLRLLGSLFVGPGVRYVDMDAEAGVLYTVNYMNGWLSAWDTKTWTLLGRRWVGQRGRAINHSHDGKKLLFATRVGLMAVTKNFWRSK